MFLAGRANPNDSAMIAAIWANESNFEETPSGDTLQEVGESSFEGA